jgi:hypothetical protein
LGVIPFPTARPRPVSVAFAAVIALAALFSTAAPAWAGGPRLVDAPPVWEEDDRREIPLPKTRDPNLLRDGIDESFFRPVGRLFHPGRAARRVGRLFGGQRARHAANLNALDEIPNSAWFTNRIGLYPVSPEAAARGPTQDDGPDRSGPWTIVRAKSEGVTPGFTIKDARGDTYFIKFDPPCCPGMSTAAGVITGRALYTIGFNVPEDFVTNFRREDLVLGEKVTLTEPSGLKRPMTVADIDTVLGNVEPAPDGSWRAIASRLLRGKPVGPFDWNGRRKDDPSDGVRHENRRELRAMRVFGAWLAHFDAKQHNSLDMYVEDGGRHYLRHYFIDFASTLGAGATGPFPKANFEYAGDFSASFGRMISLGLHEDDWRKLKRPEGLEEVGYYESEQFDPSEWKPLNPNAAFANLTDRDGYWAAKIVSAFTDAHIEALVATGKYQNPEAARWIARHMAERRDKIARHWFDRVPPLDFFATDQDLFRFRDLGVDRGIYPASGRTYRIRLATCDAERKKGAWTQWLQSERPEFDLTVSGASEVMERDDPARRPFVAIEASVSRAGKWSHPVRAYVARASGRVVAVER